MRGVAPASFSKWIIPEGYGMLECSQFIILAESHQMPNAATDWTPSVVLGASLPRDEGKGA